MVHIQTAQPGQFKRDLFGDLCGDYILACLCPQCNFKFYIKKFLVVISLKKKHTKALHL